MQHREDARTLLEDPVSGYLPALANIALDKDIIAQSLAFAMATQDTGPPAAAPEDEALRFLQLQTDAPETCPGPPEPPPSAGACARDSAEERAVRGTRHADETTVSGVIKANPHARVPVAPYPLQVVAPDARTAQQVRLPNFGFLPELLDESLSQFICNQLHPQSMREIENLNRCVPMRATWLDALLNPRPSPGALSSFRATEPVIRLAVLSNYYFKGMSILRRLKRILQDPVTASTITVVRSSFSRHILPVSNRMENVLYLLGGTQITDDAAIRCLLVIEGALSKPVFISNGDRCVYGLDLDLFRKNCMLRFLNICPLFMCLRFTRGLDMYADIIRDAVRFDGGDESEAAGFSLLCSLTQTPDIESTCNDTMFLIGFGHLVWMFEKTLEDLYYNITSSLSMIDESMYLVCLQVPAARKCYEQFVHTMSELLSRHKKLDLPAFSLILKSLFAVVRHASLNNVMLHPGLIRSGILQACEKRFQISPMERGECVLQNTSNLTLVNVKIPPRPQSSCRYSTIYDWRGDNPLQCMNPLKEMALYSPDPSKGTQQDTILSRPLLCPGIAFPTRGQPAPDSYGHRDLNTSLTYITGLNEYAEEMTLLRELSSEALFPPMVMTEQTWLCRFSKEFLSDE